jgi:hypothetical protein
MTPKQAARLLSFGVRREAGTSMPVPHPKANVFVASSEEASSGALSAVPDGVNGADLYGINADSIAALHYALLVQPYQADDIDPTVLGTHEQVYVYNELHGGWLFRFPDDVVAALVCLQGSDLARVAGDWSRIFEQNSSPPSCGEIDQMLRQIVALAQGALRQGKRLYWLAPGC